LLLSRYEAGDHRAVWDELHSVRDFAALEPLVQQDVRGVVRATVRRATQNIRTIYRSLTAAHFAFSDPLSARPTNRDGPAIRQALVAAAGPIPILLEAWLEAVNLVTFRGCPRAADAAIAWKAALFDPFEFACSRQSVREDLENRRPDERFGFSFAGDTWQKNDISGGPSTRIILHSGPIDASVLESREQNPVDVEGIWFVDYLRRYFDGGGFRATSISKPNAFPPLLVSGLVPV
jgi:hypothetical protein